MERKFLVSKFYIQTSNLDFSKNYDAEGFINTFECRVWEVIDEINLNVITINWDRIGLEHHHEITCKELLRFRCGKSNCSYGPLYARTKTIKNDISNFRLVCSSMYHLFDSEKRFDQLTLEDIKNVIRNVAFKNDTIKKSRSLEVVSFVFYRSSRARKIGAITDGVIVKLPSKLTCLVGNSVKDTLESRDVVYENWAQHGTWDRLPVDSALYALNYQFELLQSEQTSFLLEYFKFQRSDKRVELNEIYRGGGFLGSFIEIAKKISNSDSNIKNDNVYKLAEIFVRYGFIGASGSISKNFYPAMFTNEGIKVKNACAYIVTQLTGIRISEVATIRISSFTFSSSKNGDRFYSRIAKTDQGMLRSRSVSRHVYHAIDIATKISYLEIGPEHVSPFTRTNSKKFFNFSGNIEDIKNISVEALAQKINMAYKDSLKVAPANIIFPKNISPHSLRHTFAAIAIRAFKGDMRDHLRRHFGHSFDSRWTDRYAHNKLSQVISSAAESDFFKQFVYDIIGEDDIEFYAAVAKRMRERISHNHRILTIPELERYFVDESIEACEVIGHEFGYSLPLIAHKNEFDIHHLTENTKTEDAVRIGITHQHLIDTCKNDGVRKASESVLKFCNNILDSLEKSLLELEH